MMFKYYNLHIRTETGLIRVLQDIPVLMEVFSTVRSILKNTTHSTSYLVSVIHFFCYKGYKYYTKCITLTLWHRKI